MKAFTALALAAALAAAPAAFADNHAAKGDAPGPVMGAGMMMEHMDECAGLDLDDSQKQQVKAIMEEQRKKHEAIRDETHERVSAVLTPEQRKKFEEHRAEMKDMRDERRDKRAERMKKCDQDGKGEKKRFWSK